MAGSDAGDDEDDSAMATIPTEKVDSDEDSDRGSDHSGLKRKSLAMKVSVGWGRGGWPGQGTRWLYHGAFLKPTVSGGGGETNSLWILWWEMGLSVVLVVSQLSHDACGVVGWPVLVGFAAWGRIQSCRSECSCCRAGWEELEKALPGKHLLSRVGGEGVGFSHLVISPLPDASDKTASEILQ